MSIQFLKYGWVIKHCKFGYYFGLNENKIYWTSRPELEGCFVFKSKKGADHIIAFLCSGMTIRPLNRTEFQVMPFSEQCLDHLLPTPNDLLEENGE